MKTCEFGESVDDMFSLSLAYDEGELCMPGLKAQTSDWSWWLFQGTEDQVRSQGSSSIFLPHDPASTSRFCPHQTTQKIET